MGWQEGVGQNDCNMKFIADAGAPRQDNGKALGRGRSAVGEAAKAKEGDELGAAEAQGEDWWGCMKRYWCAWLPWRRGGGRAGGAAGERAGVEATTHRSNNRNLNADRPNKRNRNADRPNDVLSSKGGNADSPREWSLETVPSKRKCG